MKTGPIIAFDSFMIEKGITRRLNKRTSKFEYYSVRGILITNERIIQRCNKLVLPPAWQDVRISTDPNANLQATGKDARGRIQYKYHTKWTQAQAEKKFDGMVAFANMLPVIRKAVQRDLSLEGMPKEKVVALIVKLIDLYHFRVGNDEYAKTNKSYGLTTIKKGHVTFDRSKSAEGEIDAVFEFVGKSGKLWKRRIWEDDLAYMIADSGAIGNQSKNVDLFKYQDANGLVHDIKSHHVNDYLDSITPSGEKVTAKDFRTWAATWKTASRLAKQHDPDTITARKRLANEVVKTVAFDLGNTPAVCRSSYIHPSILDDWQEGRFRNKWNKSAKSRKIMMLSKDETATLAYIDI
jgi:DNA topoisomerase-1